jgi:2-iminoacetate synthase
LPRIQKVTQDFSPQYIVSDKDLVQFICAFRLVFPDIGISLSTREPVSLRNNLIKLGITSLSAESHTSPGAYSGKEELEQFSTSDNRSLNDIQEMLGSCGYETVMKDWDSSLN